MRTWRLKRGNISLNISPPAREPPAEPSQGFHGLCDLKGSPASHGDAKQANGGEWSPLEQAPGEVDS